jgi:hypothetical protein
MRPKFQYILSFVPLTIGGVLYIAYRPLDLKMFHWFRLIGIEKFILDLREIFSSYTPPDFFIYNLPYGLWSFSFSSLLILIWKFKLEKGLFLYLIISFSLVIVPELLQYFEKIPGTFDLIDVLTNTVCFFSPIFFLFYKSK